MGILILVISLLLAMAALPLLIIRKRRTEAIAPETEDRAIAFLEHFCRLRAEQELVGSAYLTFHRNNGALLYLNGEMNLFFSGSIVTIRETFGPCRPEDIPAVTERIRCRLLSTCPDAEIDAGAHILCIR